jgi:hypothetical protein
MMQPRAGEFQVPRALRTGRYFVSFAAANRSGTGPWSAALAVDIP